MFGQPSYLGVATADWVAALKSSDSLERRLAAHALAEIGRAGREAAVPALTEALRDSVSFVRVWAAAALARVRTGKPRRHPRSGRGDARWDLLRPQSGGVAPGAPRAATPRNRGRGAGAARAAQRRRPERARRGAGGAWEPRGQGRTARGTDVSLCARMIRH